MGRKRKNIDKSQFESLCELQCTLEEFCGFFDCCSETLNAWCKRTYGKSFSEVFREKRQAGKISLRRASFELAKKNAAMNIYLWENWFPRTDSETLERLDALMSDLDAQSEEAGEGDAGCC